MRAMRRVGVMVLAAGALLCCSPWAEACHKCRRAGWPRGCAVAPGGYGESPYGYGPGAFSSWGGYAEGYPVATIPKPGPTLEDRVGNLEEDMKEVNRKLDLLLKNSNLTTASRE